MDRKLSESERTELNVARRCVEAMMNHGEDTWKMVYDAHDEYQLNAKHRYERFLEGLAYSLRIPLEDVHALVFYSHKS